jgi:hypothetical protein
MWKTLHWICKMLASQLSDASYWPTMRGGKNVREPSQGYGNS